MDKFKSFMKEYATDNPSKLPNGHRNRFMEKLTGSTKSKHTRNRTLWLAIAATAAVVTIVLLLPGDPGPAQNRKDPVLSEMSYEMGELERFFISRIEDLTKSGLPEDPILRLHLENFERLEQECENLRKALAKNFGDERVINAMMHNYKMRITVLENMRQTQHLLQTNKLHHENKS